MSWAYDVSQACRFLIGAVFAVSVLSKVRSRPAWRSYCSWLRSVPLGALGLRGAPATLAAAEAAVVILIAVSPMAAGGLALGSVLCLALTLGLLLAVRRGARQPCHCFGSSSEPLGYHHVARNALLLALASTGLACSVAAGGRSAGAAEVTLAAIGGLAAAMLFIFFVDIAALLRAGMPGMAPAQQAGNR